jgi:hypothetical protein
MPTPREDLWHYLNMARTDARLRQQRHGHRNRRWRGDRRWLEDLFIIGALIIALGLWLVGFIV